MQFAGMILMGALALTQIIQVPRRVAHHPIYGRARWLMATGLALLSIQFFLQYFYGFREMGVNQAVFINLLFFVPCTLSMSLAILFVQRQGHVTYHEWMMGWRLCAVMAAILIATVLADGIPFREYSPALRTAEYIGAAIYLIIQSFYFILHVREYHRMRNAVSEYYDRDRNDLLGWMGLSIVVLALVALFVPAVIFVQGHLLTTFAVFFLCLIYYSACSFHAYGISLDNARVEEAEQSVMSDDAEVANESGGVLSDADKAHVKEASDKWVESGAYCKPNLTLSSVAEEMDIQRYLLKAWLRETEFGKLSTWLNHLRTDEAKRLMTVHPDWALDSIAEQCGFSSRQYFHKVFHEITGITPTHFALTSRLP